ncbi:multidrug resistance-associated protein 1-like [Oscarella lobularis]|uniref:multidrug resistance-associated protein 1-like n=1 Tax=Oscarella lobularis TaxID=121494 RepID=UPI003313CFA9
MSANDRLNAMCRPVSDFWGHAVSIGQIDLTPCFEDVALLLVPSTFLILLATVQFFVESRPDAIIIVRRTKLHVLRTAFAICLGLTGLADLARVVSYTQWETFGASQVASYQYLSPAILFVIMVLVVLSIQWFRNRGARAPGTLLLFWFLMLIYGSLRLRTYILIKTYGAVSFSTAGHDITFHLTLSVVKFVLILISFVLSIMPDRTPHYDLLDSDSKVCPEAKATFLSKISFWWMTSMIFTGYKRPLTDDDLFDLFPDDKAKVVVPRFLNAWNHEVNKTKLKNARKSQPSSHVKYDSNGLNGSVESLDKVAMIPLHDKVDRRGPKAATPSLSLALAKAFGGLMLTAAVFKFGQDVLTFMGPQLLKLMINFTKDKSIPVWRGYVYAVLLFCSAQAQSLLLHQYFHRCYRTGLRVKTAIISAVYRKAMRMNNQSRRESTVGEIVNLMAVDARRFLDLMPYIQMIWSAPFQIILAMFFLWETIGVFTLAGLAVLILLIPVNGALAVVSKKLQVKQMKYKDERIKLINEALSGIKVIKFYAWEKSFLKTISDVRKKELAVLKAILYLMSVTRFMWTCAPFLVALTTFSAYTLTGHRLTPDKALVSLSLFDILRFPLVILPGTISSLVEAYVSMKRVTKFLQNDELDPEATDRSSEGDDDDVIKVEEASFYWSKDDRVILREVSLSVKPKKLVAVVGHVGAGKSSLISAFLGEMEKDGGSVTLKGSVAYASQQAWIQNATLRENILFGLPYDPEKYNRTIDVCALEPDLDVLPGGDMTEIGEKGINLSGGQKQRVSLARAVYHNRDVYLLDDPLSAVDSHVGKHIFDNVIGPEGVLSEKVRIFVTHSVVFLPQCDQIVVMKDGIISEVGTYNELQTNNGDFANFLRIYARADSPNADDEKNDDGNDDVKKEADDKDSATKQQTSDSPKPEERRHSTIEKEKTEVGNVKFGVYAIYLRSLTWPVAALTVVFYLLQNGASVGSNIWLAKWSDDEIARGRENETNVTVAPIGYYLGIYASFGFGQALAVLLTSLAVVLGTLIAATNLHRNLLVNILRSPMSFFDTTPLGRIVNRFSKDIYMVDEAIPMSLRWFLDTFFNVIAIVFIISYSTPIFLVVLLPLGVLYFFTQRFYVATSRQLQRIESVTRSPIYSHFQETLNGTSTIRAYGATEQFVAENEMRVDTNQTAYYPNVCSNRWLAVRLEFVGNCIILFAALFAVIERNDSHVSAGLVGLSISYSLQITQTLNWMVRMTSQLEANIVSVERVKEYSETPTEAPAIVDNCRPSPGWPNLGEVEFNSYSTRYRDGLDLVLKDVDCRVKPSEKIGIAGRTGAGKSSLTLSVFRLIEAAGGSIVVDGVDIARLGLDDLRSRITIIPQDPVLFSGTLRLNLDPFEEHSDDEIWQSLENAHLKEFFTLINADLNYEISEGGENLSVGQRQLVCLARALLRKTKILVLDEATAAVDLETDDLIQKTIRREFADCTILTIAHRINTIMDSDRIIVLDKGQIVEFDSPANLLSKRGIFYGMAVDAGLA